MLLYLVAKWLPGLKLILPGVKVKKDRGPICLCNYRYYKTNVEILPVAFLSVMRYGRALDRLLHEIVFADPSIGPVYILKADMSDSFYYIGVRPEDTPKIGLTFPSGANEVPMVAILLILPIDWKNSLPLIFTSKETVADLVNYVIRSHQVSKRHKLDQ